jgi:hypothetical protein
MALSEDLDDNYLAYIKYEGELVQTGYLDARKSAEALVGIDEVVRYFLFQEDPILQELQFDIPVRIRKGSWEALLPNNIEEWIKTAVGLGITTYATTALKKLAENDFKDKKIKDVFTEVFKGIKWVIRIAKHLGKMAVKKIENIQFENNNTSLRIPNQKGEFLIVPYKYFQLYINCPEKLFSRITNVIESGRELSIGLNASEVDSDDDKVEEKIGVAQKYIFTREEIEDEILFPELIHNSYIELEGHVTRGNENANTIGFQYQGHILTCFPAQGNITKHKSLLFTNCLIKGYVDRTGYDGEINEKRPRLRYIDLVALDKLDNTNTLFGGQ